MNSVSSSLSSPVRFSSAHNKSATQQGPLITSGSAKALLAIPSAAGGVLGILTSTGNATPGRVIAVSGVGAVLEGLTFLWGWRSARRHQ